MSKKDEAMKLALEALSPWAGEDANHTEQYAAYAACREALAEQPAPATELREQEPVAWRTYTGRGYYIIDATLEEAQRNWPDKQHQPLYTSPPAQRTWVGLVWGELPEDGHDHDFLRGAVWAEAKLKEKNT